MSIESTHKERKMNKGRRISTFVSLALMLTVTLTALSLGVTPALADGATVLHVDVSFLGPPPNHPCTGGTLEANGMITVILKPTGQGYFVHIGSGGGGVTMTDVDTGVVYKFVGALNDHTVSSGGGTTVHHLNYISPGSDTDFIGQFVEHVTITPDGDVSVSFDWGRVQCK